MRGEPEGAGERGPPAVAGRGGGALERLVFGHRLAVVLACAAATAALGALAAARLEVSADPEAMLPADQPIVRTWLAHRGDLRGLGDTLHVVVEHRHGDVWDARYLDALRRLGDDLLLTPGVDRAWVRSLWMPGVRWSEVTEEGFQGGPVMPDDFDGSPRSLEALRRNVRRAGLVGDLVGSDERSSAIFVPLLDRDPATGRAVDPVALHARLEGLRSRLEGEGAVTVRIVGAAELTGTLVAGMRDVLALFAAAAVIATLLVLAATRCPRSTAVVAACSLAAVVWQVGLVAALGVALDPYSIVVPFLTFALGLSHGAQKMNGVLRDVGRGAGRVDAARSTFRRLFGTGVTALLTDGVGFAALAAIDIPAIRRLALTAGLGVAALVVTNLVLLPVLLSFTGVSPRAAARGTRAAGPGPGAWRFVERLTERRRAAVVLGVGAVAVAAALWEARGLEVGDVEPGAPQLRAGSRYNLDAAYLADRYTLGSDRFAVLVRTGPGGCADHRTLVEADRLAWELQHVPGVRATATLADAVRRLTAGGYEGSPKWSVVSRQQEVLNHAVLQAATVQPDLQDAGCSLTPVVAYLADHRAATLDGVVEAAAAFAAAHGGEGREFLLAAGSAALQAATDREVREAGLTMTLAAYGAVVLLCALVFRSWRAVVVTVVPLAATSALCAGLMAVSGIGVTVATLPAIALGVGIPDHALYLLSVQLAHQRAGLPLAEAHRRALRFTGRAVLLVGVTLTCGVAAWTLSPIRMQADLGFLLAFMFLGSVAGALLLIPALSAFLLAGTGGRGGRP